MSDCDKPDDHEVVDQNQLTTADDDELAGPSGSDLFGLIGDEGDGGIVNFLSDAIGRDVGTAVLHEFSGSEAFAELLEDVVTSSLTTGTSNTTTKHESSLNVTRITQPTKNLETKKPHKSIGKHLINFKKLASKSEQSQSPTKSSKQRTKYETKTRKEVIRVPTPPPSPPQSRKIQNRLKIRPKFSPEIGNDVKDEDPSTSTKQRRSKSAAAENLSKQSKKDKSPNIVAQGKQQRINKNPKKEKRMPKKQLETSQNQKIVPPQKISVPPRINMQPCKVIMISNIFDLKAFYKPKSSSKDNMTFIISDLDADKLDAFENRFRKNINSCKSEKKSGKLDATSKSISTADKTKVTPEEKVSKKCKNTISNTTSVLPSQAQSTSKPVEIEINKDNKGKRKKTSSTSISKSARKLSRTGEQKRRISKEFQKGVEEVHKVSNKNNDEKEKLQSVEIELELGDQNVQDNPEQSVVVPSQISPEDKMNDGNAEIEIKVNLTNKENEEQTNETTEKSASLNSVKEIETTSLSLVNIINKALKVPDEPPEKHTVEPELPDKKKNQESHQDPVDRHPVPDHQNAKETTILSSPVVEDKPQLALEEPKEVDKKDEPKEHEMLEKDEPKRELSTKEMKTTEDKQKHSDEKNKKRDKRRVDEKKKLEEHSLPNKTFATSFRIPKKQDQNTPLGRLIREDKAETLKESDRFINRTGNDETITSVRKGSASYQSGRFQDDTSKKVQSPPSTVKDKAHTSSLLKEQQTQDTKNEDKAKSVDFTTDVLPPDPERSLFGDTDHSLSCESTLPPATHVDAGDFTLAVTGMLQEKSKTKVSTFENFTKSTEETFDIMAAEKCAWWFALSEKDPPLESDGKMPALESPPSSHCSADIESDDEVSTFAERNARTSSIDHNRDEIYDCQVHEISSSTSHRIDNAGHGVSTRDPDKVDEYCGRSLLQAKIGTSSGKGFQNIFELRSGALYEKENFQAKCNLCKQLIVGRRDLAKHIRGFFHKDKLRRIGGADMEPDTLSAAEKVVKNENEKPKTSKEQPKEEVKPKIETETKESHERKSSSSSPRKNGHGEKKDASDRKDKNKESEVQMEIGRTSSGLEVKVPVQRGSGSRSPSRRRRTRSPRPKRRSRSRSRGRRRRSRSPRRGSRSPVLRIPRSPERAAEKIRSSRRSRSRSIEKMRRRSRSRSRSRSPPPRKSSRKKRSKSPSSRHYSKRSRRSRSRSPELNINNIKRDKKLFLEKLALTAEGKWTDVMETQMALMEAEEAMYLEKFYDRRKSYVSIPEEHPQYAVEWTKYWERRYQEVEKLGLDPDSYDYVSEWKEFWSKRLKTLLEEEANTALEEMKRKYQMDFESLNRLKKAGNFSSPAPFPTGIPENVLRASGSTNIKIDQSGPPSFNSHLSGSMGMMGSSSLPLNNSQLFGGDRSVLTSNNELDNMKQKVSVQDIKSTWEALTRPKTVSLSADDLVSSFAAPPTMVPEPVPFSQRRRQSEAKSEITTSSDASYDFDGFDLVQVLRLMCKCEDQLSFLAPKVLEFYKVAEELELKASRGSHVLLNNEELVSVLFQARDRFMSMIRSNVLSREILKSLNLTVYGLNSILDAPQCQRFRPKLPSTLSEVDNTVMSSNAQPMVEDDSTKSRIDSLLFNGSDESKSLLKNVRTDQKEQIAAEIAKYLFLMGREDVEDEKLTNFLAQLLLPLLKSENGKDNKANKKSSTDPASTEKQKKDAKSAASSSAKLEQHKPETVMRLDNAHSFDIRISGVSSSKVVGSALPSLPHLGRASADDEIMPSMQNLRPHHESSRKEDSNKEKDDGRSSPFSRREFSGNLSRL